MKDFIIDVKKAINIHHAKNPDQPKLSTFYIADELGVNVKSFTDWKTKKAPKIVKNLFKIKEITGCDFQDFVTEKKQ